MLSSTSHVEHRPYAKLFAAFFAGLLVAAAGLYAGQYVPPALRLPLIICEILLIIAMVIVRRRKAVGYGMMFAFMLVSGLTLYPVIAHYVSVLGADAVLRAVGISAFAFGGTAIFAMVSKRDFTFLGNFLFVSILVLIGMGLLSIFIPFSSSTAMVVSLFGILVFVGYTLYDFSRLTLYGFTEKDIPMIVVSVYLDFVNLFIYILQFMGILSKD
ncbi:FtsH-binding integral membrane protein [Scopulibacillus daqui]|uniref:FtsH-binding integral membrane protein n=1 Tax=Scopulibacillus daqui TaxID=1469162 RepID=A0ABS2PZS3_9BACL|nr:Bax inhibitor-1/YccA family protein [Scopulibacillus daqui]MBM7645553.1 FtsH-binding integral membrane protein [Scopulibacillus daqui]